MEGTEFNPSVGKRLLGIFACTLAGVAGGVLASIFAWLWGVYGQAGVLGQGEPGFIEPIISGGWIFAIIGIIPGLLIGFTYGITNNDKIWITVVLLVMFSCYLSEIVYGYPTSIPACFFYIGAPMFIVFGSAWFSSRLKIRLNLMPPEQAKGFEEADDNMFNDKS